MVNSRIVKLCFSVLFTLLTIFVLGTGQTAEAAESNGQKVVDEAHKYLGTPYKFGGTTPQAFDCSGFIQYVYREAIDFQLPRSSREQWQYGTSVSRSNLQPGDLIFFKDKEKDQITHDAIYIGNNKIIHATVSKGVKIDTLTKGSYWDVRYEGAKRYRTVADTPLIKEAKALLGTPYKAGGTTPTGFNTSGFTQYVYKKALNTALPQWVDQQWETGSSVSKSNLKAGDLVFFSTRTDGQVNNVGLYYANGQFFHVSTADGVKIAYITSDFWKDKYKGARRIK